MSINVGWKQNLDKTLAPEKILTKNIGYARAAGLSSVKWLLTIEDLQFLKTNNYHYVLQTDQAHVYRVELKK